MKFQFLDTISALSGSVANTATKTIPAGNYSGIRLTLTGTTAPGETLTLDDIGTVYVNHSERGQIARVDFGFLNYWQNIKGGFPPTVSGAAETAERVVATIPFGDPDFPNTQNPATDRELSFKVEFGSAMATRFSGTNASLRVDLIKESDVSQDYDYMIESQNQQANGAGDITDTLTGANIVSTFLKENANVNSITLRQDERTVADNTPFDVLKDQTNIQNRIEAAGQPWAELRSANITRASTRNRSTDLVTSFSSSGTMEVYKFRMSYLNPGAVQASESRVASELARN